MLVPRYNFDSWIDSSGSTLFQFWIPNRSPFHILMKTFHMRTGRRHLPTTASSASVQSALKRNNLFERFRLNCCCLMFVKIVFTSINEFRILFSVLPIEKDVQWFGFRSCFNVHPVLELQKKTSMVPWWNRNLLGDSPRLMNHVQARLGRSQWYDFVSALK